MLCVLFAPEPVPGTRYRVLQYLPVLEAHGLQCDLLPLLSPATARASVSGAAATPLTRLRHWGRVWWETQLGCMRMLRRLSRYDRILLYRVALPGWAAWALRRRKADTIYDYDDALDAGEGRTLIERLRQRILRRSLERAVVTSAAVSTSNTRNASVVTALGGRALVVPTSVDLGRYRPRPEPRSSGPVVLGWIGTPSTAQYLPAIEEALMEVLARKPGTRIQLVGSGGNPFTRLEPEVLPWTARSEIDYLLGFDVGLMPMPDTAWTRGKAALKALQYGGAGIPTVGSWTSTNAEILEAGGGAVLCRTTEDWVTALLSLIDDGPRRQAMGAAARTHVARTYSVQVNGPRLAALVRDPQRGGA